MSFLSFVTTLLDSNKSFNLEGENMAQASEGLLESGLEKAPPAAHVPQEYVVKATSAVWELVRPSFLSRNRTTHKLRRTAYLDGLRGLAAFLVYYLHNSNYSHGYMWAMPVFENAYGYEGRYYFAALPIIRLFFTGGHLGVATFFVISGYVLSAKPLSLIHAGPNSAVGLGDNLASALFRRFLRLFLPVAGTTFVYMTMWHALGVKPEIPVAQPTYLEEVSRWWQQFKGYTFIFNNGLMWMDYNVHTWSIPIEFRGSIVIYTALVAFSRCTRNARLLGTAVLIYYFYAMVYGWYCALFCSGMLLCDLDMLSQKDQLPFKGLLRRLEAHQKHIYLGIFVLALLLGGTPCNLDDINVMRNNPGWHYMSYLVPSVMSDPKWAFLTPAAVMMVFVIPRISWLKAFFESGPIQYLGRISFSLYLVHGPIIWTLGDRMYALTGMSRQWQIDNLPQWDHKLPLPLVGPLGLEPCFLVPQFLVIMPFTFWVAEIVTKLFDEPSIRFTQWLYGRAIREYDTTP